MSVNFDDLTKFAQKIVETIVKKQSSPQKEVMVKYNEIYNMDFIASAPSDELRHKLASTKLHLDSFSRLPMEKHSIVPIGIGAITKFGAEAEPFQDVFCWHEATNKIVAVRFDKSDLQMVEQFTIGEYYEDVDIAVSEIGNYSIDDRCKLPQPEPLLGTEENPESVDDLLTNYLNVRVIRMKDFGNSEVISKRTGANQDGRTFVINTDWVCVRNCMVQRIKKYKVDGVEGYNKGQLTVTDTSVDEPFTTPQGIVVSNTMQVWVDQRNIFPPYSYLNLWGTVEHRKWQAIDPNDRSKKIDRQNFQMNAHYIFPIKVGPDEAN